MTWIVLAAVLCLAYSNGSNDNFKGVATIYGSGTASYRKSLAWATATTLAGSLLALVLAASLAKTFSAKGLVPDAVAASPAFLGAAALGAAFTVLLATRAGLPVSTTHALTGALAGAGFVAVGPQIHLSVLGKSFFLPLLVSPMVAVLLAVVAYPLARGARRVLKVERESCVCIGAEWVPVAVPSAGRVVAAQRVSLAVSSGAVCADRYQGRVVGVSAQGLLEVLHFLSGGAVSFARGLNDTPKIVALLLAARVVGSQVGLLSVGVAMAIGGIVGARKVAETMSTRITKLSGGSGLVANLNTALLVIVASRFGMPVSTTHVATGGLFGVGIATGAARWKTIASILAAWLTTLPLGAAFGGIAFYLLLRMG